MKPTPKEKTRVHDLGEFGLIHELRGVIGPARGSVVVGIGDDCAVLRGGHSDKYLLYTCDPVVEGVHYQRTDPPCRVGWKAMARNLSDIAAMGGVPVWAVVSIGLRRNMRAHWVKELYAGLQAAARKFGCQIVGGDTTHVKHEQFVVVALIGEVERSRMTPRSGAKVGDSIFVTGALGGSRRGKHLTFTPRINEARWLVGNFPVHAMIDLSDGLSSDLQRLVEASRPGIGFEIHAAEIPIARAARGSLAAALHDGEDFELLFTIDPRQVTTLRQKWPRKFDLELMEIGRVVRSRQPVTLIAMDGSRRPLKSVGYDHFATS
ncbi:MAG TPA: thiamine-phosphate kinase [Verrucomicrobiae bacterium]|nr:thiamine-phosphate kinase [Verrucomicrobiae bacterium]